jgi:cytochrome c nitrite reductase small subunit
VIMYRGVREGRRCAECHREVPHGRVSSLSSVPNAFVPTLGAIIPDWIKK